MKKEIYSLCLATTLLSTSCSTVPKSSLESKALEKSVKAEQVDNKTKRGFGKRTYDFLKLMNIWINPLGGIVGYEIFDMKEPYSDNYE